ARGGPTHRLKRSPQPLSWPGPVRRDSALSASERLSPSARERAPALSLAAWPPLIPSAADLADRLTWLVAGRPAPGAGGGGAWTWTAGRTARSPPHGGPSPQARRWSDCGPGCP